MDVYSRNTVFHRFAPSPPSKVAFELQILQNFARAPDLPSSRRTKDSQTSVFKDAGGALPVGYGLLEVGQRFIGLV